MPTHKFPEIRCVKHPVTPDGRYFVVHGRLWRMSNPALGPVIRQSLVEQLMSARRAIRLARQGGDTVSEAKARAAVDEAKRMLGERGAVWWNDGAPDLSRRMAMESPYADWFVSLTREN